MKTKHIKINSSACQNDIKDIEDAVLIILTCESCGKQYNIETHISERTPHKAKSGSFCHSERIKLTDIFEEELENQ